MKPPKIAFLVLFILFIGCDLKLSRPSADVAECLHTNLSKDFDFKVNAQHFLMEDGVADSLDVDITVINKHTKAEKQIHFGSGWMFEETYTDCGHVRSYTTNVKPNAEIADNDFGDIVVADMNFDCRDDFVIKKNSGGNTGPDYAFYIQDEKGGFNEDRFLTDSVGYFPDDIDAAKKQITTVAMAGAWCVSERIYSYDTITKKWKSLRHTIWQEYKFTKLSDKFDFTLSVSEIPQPDEEDSVYVAVTIAGKKGKVKQQIKFGNNFFKQPFTGNDAVRSYTTGFNNDAEVRDWDYGNLVVADFNFDGHDDLAIKYEQGGNGGPRYKYYVQEPNSIFKESEFLNAFGYFPDEFVLNAKTLIFRVRANTSQYEETVCLYKSSLKNWVVVKQEIKNWK